MSDRRAFLLRPAFTVGRSRVLTLLMALLLVAVSPGAARAVEVIVDGVIYDVTTYPNETAFDDLRTEMEATYWWDDPALAEALAYAYVDQAPRFNPTPFNDEVLFTFDAGRDGQDVGAWAARESGPVQTFILPVTAVGIRTWSFADATITGTVSVPEIDGDALAKALFILFALGLWLETRRAA